MTKRENKVKIVKKKDADKTSKPAEMANDSKALAVKESGANKEPVPENLADMTKTLENVSKNILTTAGTISKLISEHLTWMKKKGANDKAILKKLTDIEESGKLTYTLISDMASWKELQDRSEKLTPRECIQIRSEISSRVSNILGLKYVNGVLTDGSLKVREKYFPMFITRIYTDLKESGVIAGRVNDTPHSAFEIAIEKIKSWEPEQGIRKLKMKADKNRRTRLQMELSNENNPTACQHYLSRHKQLAISEIRKQDLAEIRKSSN